MHPFYAYSGSNKKTYDTSVFFFTIIHVGANRLSHFFFSHLLTERLIDVTFIFFIQALSVGIACYRSRNINLFMCLMSVGPGIVYIYLCLVWFIVQH
jgi:hypothetical protein